MDRETPMTFAPAFRNDSVTNVPSPPLAPVMIVILPSSEIIFGHLFPRRPCHTKFRIERQAATCEDGLPGDVRSLVRRQERKYRSDLVRCSGMAHRDMAFHFAAGFGIVDPSSVDRRNYGARADRIYPNPLAGILQCQRLGQVLHSALADGIGQVLGFGDDLVNARIVQNYAAARPRKKVADRFPRAKEWSAEIHRKNAVEIRRLDL